MTGRCNTMPRRVLVYSDAMEKPSWLATQHHGHHEHQHPPVVYARFKIFFSLFTLSANTGSIPAANSKLMMPSCSQILGVLMDLIFDPFSVICPELERSLTAIGYQWTPTLDPMDAIRFYHHHVHFFTNSINLHHLSLHLLIL